MGRHSTMGWMMGANGQPVAVVAQPATSLQRANFSQTQGGLMPLPSPPAWHQDEVTPGIWAPREGLEIMPMVPDDGKGIFSAGSGLITWQARPQRPFRAERLLVRVGRTATVPGALDGVLLLCQGIFVGTKLQQLQLGAFDIEVYTEQAFGVRMALDAANPGILIQMPIFAQGTIGGTDTIALNMQWLGSSVM